MNAWFVLIGKHVYYSNRVIMYPHAMVSITVIFWSNVLKSY